MSNFSLDILSLKLYYIFVSNIEKLLDSLLKLKGEKLVINTKEPIHILKSGKKKVIFKKVLSDREFAFLEAEYASVFGNKEEFNYRDTNIMTSRFENNREFSFPLPSDEVKPADSQTQISKEKTQVEVDIDPENVIDRALMDSEPLPMPSIVSEYEYEAATSPDAPTSPEAATAPESEPVSEPISVFVPESKPKPRAAAGGVSLDLVYLLKLMSQKNASDLHLSSKCKPIMRIDGDMEILEEIPEIVEEELFQELVKISPRRNIGEFKETSDTYFAYQIEGLGRFRSNIFRDTRGVGAVFRRIPSKILTTNEINIPPAVVELCNTRSTQGGLILVTGPTGSGISTTLAALTDYINRTQKRHIITLEDPVEFVHPNKLSLVNQREIHTHIQSFKQGLQAAVREDPDIILLSKIQDVETLAIVLETAAAGPLVFSTLHTPTAIGTIDWIISQFPTHQKDRIKAMLADALVGVVSQTLLKRKGKGRVAAYEVLVVNDDVSNLIREVKNLQVATIMQTARSPGMQMINSHLTKLVEQGIVTPEEAISKAIDKGNLRTTLKAKGLWKE
jgi:twitching motility protein PilT